MKSNSQKIAAVAVFAACVLCASAVWAETWHLKPGGNWENLGTDPNGKFILAVAKIKMLISKGLAGEAAAEFKVLKKEFNDLAGPDLDAFMEAELLYAGGKWKQAVGKYNDFLDAWPDSWLFEAANERLYSIGLAYLNGEKTRSIVGIKFSGHDSGATIMRQIADRRGTAPIAKRALVALARSYTDRGEYLEAHEVWAEIKFLWPTGETGQMALLETALNLHSSYKGPLYTDTDLRSARTFYQNYATRYTEAAAENQVDEQLDLIREQLAYKQYTVGEYYEKTESYESAAMYYRFVIDNWPETKAGLMAKAGADRLESGPQPEQKATSRKIVEASTHFLDNWFYLPGLKKNADKND